MTAIKKDKKRFAVLSLLLALVVAAGLTAAYLFTKTEPLTNEFTFAENIDAKLTEPGWTDGDPDSDDPNDWPGWKQAQNLVPGKVVPKDPQITNTSENGVSEWVAIRLVFTDGDSVPLSGTDDAADRYIGKLLSLIEIDWNTADWQLADPAMADKVTQVWAYKYELVPDETTPPLFNTVTIKDSVTPAELAWLRDHLGGFNIVLQGAAVQYEVFENLAAAIPALLDVLAQA
jgi:hypothetical protein